MNKLEDKNEKFIELKDKIKVIVDLNHSLREKKNSLMKKAATFVQKGEITLEKFMEDRTGWLSLAKLEKFGFRNILIMLLKDYFESQGKKLTLENFSIYNEEGIVFLLFSEDELDLEVYQNIIKSYRKIPKQSLKLSFLVRKRGQQDRLICLSNKKVILEKGSEKPIVLENVKTVNSDIFKHDYFKEDLF